MPRSLPPCRRHLQGPLTPGGGCCPAVTSRCPLRLMMSPESRNQAHPRLQPHQLLQRRSHSPLLPAAPLPPPLTTTTSALCGWRWSRHGWPLMTARCRWARCWCPAGARCWQRPAMRPRAPPTPPRTPSCCASGRPPRRQAAGAYWTPRCTSRWSPAPCAQAHCCRCAARGCVCPWRVHGSPAQELALRAMLPAHACLPARLNPMVLVPTACACVLP